MTTHIDLLRCRAQERPVCTIEVLCLRRCDRADTGCRDDLARYVTLDGQEPRFDGHRARAHLTRHLAFVEHPLAEAAALQPAFDRWLRVHQDAITLHPRGPILLVPPPWYST